MMMIDNLFAFSLFAIISSFLLDYGTVTTTPTADYVCIRIQFCRMPNPIQTITTSPLLFTMQAQLLVVIAHNDYLVDLYPTYLSQLLFLLYLSLARPVGPDDLFCISFSRNDDHCTCLSVAADYSEGSPTPQVRG